MTNMSDRNFKVGDRVHGRDAAPDAVDGTVVKVIGLSNLPHARVEWDNGASKVHRCDTLVHAASKS